MGRRSTAGVWALCSIRCSRESFSSNDKRSLNIDLLESGSHPFDYHSESQCVPEGASQSSLSQGSLSQRSEAGAALVCDRILDGSINLNFAPWFTMRDGRLFSACMGSC